MIDIRKLSKDEIKTLAKPIIINKHYAGRMPSVSYAYGMFKDGNIIGVVTFGKPASNSLCIGVCGKEYSSKVFELNRLIFIEDVHNGASKLIGFALRDLKQYGLIIVSYADTGANHAGYVYQATNFLYTGKTAKRTDKYVGDGIHSRHYQGKESKKYRQVRTSKHRYVTFVGSKTQTSKFRKALNYSIEPYPKTENIRYNLGDKIKPILIPIK